MKFEIKYADNSTVVVEVDDAELRAWIRAKAFTAASNAFEKAQAAKGSVVSAVVK